MRSGNRPGGFFVRHRHQAAPTGGKGVVSKAERIYIAYIRPLECTRIGGVMVSIVAFQAVGQGSIPCRFIFVFAAARSRHGARILCLPRRDRRGEVGHRPGFQGKQKKTVMLLFLPALCSERRGGRKRLERNDP